MDVSGVSFIFIAIHLIFPSDLLESRSDVRLGGYMSKRFCLSGGSSTSKAATIIYEVGARLQESCGEFNYDFLGG